MEKAVSLCHPLPERLLFLLQNYFWFKSYLNLEMQGLDYFFSVWISTQENWVICTVSKANKKKKKERKKKGGEEDGHYWMIKTNLCWYNNIVKNTTGTSIFKSLKSGLVFHFIFYSLNSLLLWSTIILGPSHCFLTSNVGGDIFSTGVAGRYQIESLLSFSWHWPWLAPSQKI